MVGSRQEIDKYPSAPTRPRLGQSERGLCCSEWFASLANWTDATTASGGVRRRSFRLVCSAPTHRILCASPSLPHHLVEEFIHRKASGPEIRFLL